VARYNVCELLANAWRRAQSKQPLGLNASQRKAVSILVAVLKRVAKVPLGGIQGPPGTGKTSVVEAFTKNHMVDMLDELENEIVIYVAPTNHLAAQAFERVIAALLTRGYTIRDIVDRVRIYGSRIYAANCDKIFAAKNIEEKPPSDNMKRIVYGEVDPSIVKIVFATEYQRVSGRFISTPSAIHLVVDEASKSPFYRTFISIADTIMRSKSYPASLVALGDPEQAITVPEAFKAYRVSLLMNKITELLKRSGLKQDNFVMLDTTYRLPEPSEQPISHGFYDDRLRAFEHARFRLKPFRDLFVDNRSWVESELRRTVHWDTEFEKIFEAVYEAVTTGKPIVVIETDRFSAPSSARTFDKRRAALGAKASLVLQAFAKAARTRGEYVEPSTMVIAPYSDLVTNVAFRFVEQYGRYFDPPDAATVQAVIGGEADAVIALLGKEYSASRYDPFIADTAYETMYFNEPQVLNVQLSRHHKLMILVGDVNELAKAKGKGAAVKLSRTAQKIESLRDADKIAWLDLRRA